MGNCEVSIIMMIVFCSRLNKARGHNQLDIK